MSQAKKILQLLRDHESPNVTFMEPDGSWPIVWERARGVNVWDSAGKQYLDLTAAFGVATAGHANAKVVKAGQRQMGTLLHAMGDVHPHALKAELARELSRLTFERWTQQETGKVIFSNSGFEAVESALKTAILATGRRGIIAFAGAYHGLGYGVLNATHREHFRGPFRSQLREFGHFVPYPGSGSPARPRVSDKKPLAATEAGIRAIFKREKIGAILAEPIQARAGTYVPPRGFLPLLRRLCDEHGVLLILDEIYTGFGRTGKWFACEHSGTVPDLICLGKALTGGFPLSACVGRARLMDAAWPVTTGEAIHTSTFLGHPVGCAMALAQIGEIRRLQLPAQAARRGMELMKLLSALKPTAGLRYAVRGCGLMVGMEITTAEGQPATAVALEAMKTLLQRGFIVLPEGEHGNILSFTPQLTISAGQLARTVKVLGAVLAGLNKADS